MATIREVAKRAGVAPITVSRVLNSPDTVAEQTRERVEQAIRDLKYVPNMLGQGLRHKRTHTVGLVIPDIRNPYYVPTILAVEAVAREQGYDVLLVNTDGRADLESRQLRNLVARRVDGIVLAPIYNTPDSVDFIQGQHIPVCVLDYAMPNNQVDVVRCDTLTAARELTTYLLQLGHRSLRMMTGPQDIVTARERAEGYVQAIEAFGLDVADNPVNYGSFDPVQSRIDARPLLDVASPPTAVVTASNFIALGAAHAALDLGWEIPGDLSIVTFDGPASELVLQPFFTCAETPAYEIAERAATLLLQRIHSPRSTQVSDVVLSAKLAFNLSTAAPVTQGAAR
ncbi:MAG: LacI family DNA-binding transcriptional regulator [Nostocoides sp.]